MPSSDMDGFPKKRDVDLMGTNSQGYISAQEPDGGVINGNPRGVGSAGFQVTRTANTQVPSGSYSGAFGYNNTVSGSGSFAFGNNISISSSRTVSFGASNTHTGSDTLSIGQSCTVSGPAGLTLGSSCTASGGGAFSSGNGITSAGIVRRRVVGFLGNFFRSTMFIRVATTNATPAAMTSNGGAAAANNQINVQTTGGSTFFRATIVAKQSGSSNCAFWVVTGLLHRTGNEATTTLAYSSVTAISNAPGWTNPAVTADTSFGRATITVTGVAATNIRWFGVAKATESVYS